MKEIFTNPQHLNELKEQNLITFKYCNKKGTVDNFSNPNGSLKEQEFLIHEKYFRNDATSERMVDNLISNTDRINLFSSLLN